MSITRTLPRLVCLVGLVAALGLAFALAGAEATASTEDVVDGELEPVADCWDIELPPDADVDCATLEVPADHADPDGASLDLAVAIVRTDADEPREPLVRLAGGPGGRLVGPELAALAANPEGLIGDAAADRDLVLVDQRGVGLSEPSLACPEVDADVLPGGVGALPGGVSAPGAVMDALPGGAGAPGGVMDALPGGVSTPAAGVHAPADGHEDAAPELRVLPYVLSEHQTTDPLASFEACFERLDEEVDLSAFTTAQNADDLRVLRTALARDAGTDPSEAQIALYGVSYGAKLALTAADRAPDEWSAVVLSSPLALDRSFYEELPASFDDTLDRLDAACAADPTCAQRFAEPRGSLDTAVEDLADGPAVETVPDPEGGEPHQLALDATTAANLGFQLFYQPPGAQPAAYEAMAEARVADLLLGFTTPQPLPPQPDDPDDPRAPGQSLGMLQSFVCAEEVAYADEEAYADAAGASAAVGVFAHAPLFGLIGPDVCDVWDVPAADPDPFAEVDTDTPLLVVTGGLDHITPPSWGETVADRAQDAQLVEVPSASHAPAEQAGPCGAELVASFLDDPEAEIDATCATEPPPRFHPVLSEAPTVGVARVAGDDRYETAAALSGWSRPQGAATAVVASGETFPDALSGGAAAGALGGSLVLTPADELSDEAAEELARLAPAQVYVAGGSEAVADAVVDAIGEAVGAPVERLAGADRYETAAAVSAATAPDPEEVGTVYLATGEAFPDALSGGASAAAEQAPLLLSHADRMPEATAAELDRLDPDEVVVLGGTAALSGEVAGEVAETGAEVTRVDGEDRYETAAAVAERVGPGIGWAFVASGETFADALAAGPVAAGRGPLLLARPDAVPAATEAALTARAPDYVGLAGGSAAVGEETAVAFGRFAEFSLGDGAVPE
ncbi:alpha/beta fold hydrolase [Egibacter rhizosphaerae]|uniref:Alpha/beta fold hydrolase n=1 Tax=Egibacter rhizosphaerae TaxID=1670831 RepID=A0A411YK01_9ACTN|nr:alpha/beta fold hydrolase [Egibacter rhizosphaerae]QBI21534.1 alpha/beta fold hydrolase [Egibacter rhizosphaerae]